MAVNSLNYDAYKYMGPHTPEDYPKYRKIADSKAAQIFGKLDRSDGEDGLISAEKWNEDARKNGGNEISEGHFINVWNGINSITTYEVKKAHEEEVLAKAIVKPDENGQLVVYDEKGKVLEVKGVEEDANGYIIHGKTGITVSLAKI